MSKPGGYFEHSRPEVLKLVPLEARRVLDVGCGNGALGKALKERQECFVTGLELDGTAAAQAEGVLDEVFAGDCQDAVFLSQSYPSGFDCIICADVLEHLPDPRAVLTLLKEALTADGVLVVSIPNARHHSVIAGLVNGNWSYEDAGLLDRDHLRFFTRRELQKLLWRAGFEVVKLEAVMLQESLPAGNVVQADRFCFVARDEAEAAEFRHYQYLAVAKRRERPAYGPTSIIIPVCNQLPYTRQCLQSLAETTDLSQVEVIIVDNGSADGTKEWLEGWAVEGRQRAVISNETNLGFAKACNQGLAAAGGANLVLLNNDVLLCTGWLERLLACLHSGPEVGLAGPVSNNVSGEQKVAVTYTTLGEAEGFGWDWAMAHKGERARLDRLVGFCLAIKREVVEKVGVLDEQFGLGTFEDDDYCLRARQAGYVNLVARDCFIHHFAGRTFAGEGLDMAAMQAANQKLFEAKHRGT